MTDKSANYEAVSRMQSYIEAHLDVQITLYDLSRAAGYSPWHCARIFAEITGKTPFAYIRALRLSRAALLLRDGREKVSDVAFDFVFDSHEGFTRAFTRAFGVPPKTYSNETPPIALFMPNDARSVYLWKFGGENEMTKKEKKDTVFVQVVERPGRRAVVKRGIAAEDYFAYCEEAGCDVWGVLSSVKEALYEPVGMWLPQKLIREGTSRYVQGVEVPLDYDKPLPDGYEMMELEPCRLMVFQGQPFHDDDFMDAIGDMWELMKTYDPKLYGFEWADEDSPRIQLAPQGYRGYIEARPVRALNRESGIV
jgi:AraC-like DNA-binding protein